MQPQTVDLTLTSSLSGLQGVLNGNSAATPFTRTAIVDLGGLAADPEREQLRLRLLVGRRRPDAQRHCERRDDLQRTYLRSTRQHESACHYRADLGRQDPEDVDGKLDGLDPHLVHLPMAALRRVGWRLHGDRRRHRQQVPADQRRRRPHHARERHRNKLRQLQLGNLGGDLCDQAARGQESQIPQTADEARHDLPR
jgi:hypothetical protein